MCATLVFTSEKEREQAETIRSQATLRAGIASLRKGVSEGNLGKGMNTIHPEQQRLLLLLQHRQKKLQPQRKLKICRHQGMTANRVLMFVERSNSNFHRHGTASGNRQQHLRGPVQLQRRRICVSQKILEQKPPRGLRKPGRAVLHHRHLRSTRKKKGNTRQAPGKEEQEAAEGGEHDSDEEKDSRLLEKNTEHPPALSILALTLL